MQIPVVRNVLESNDKIADILKERFDAAGVLVLNMMSSPGAGKTTLLEQTLTALAPDYKMAVIEGDLQTANDAERVAATGAQAVQINTDGGCHLDGNMVNEALKSLDTDGLDILFIENVGNLVCPAEFNLGEDAKVTLLSVTEGDDKPEKYPLMFHLSAVALLNKTDLLPYVNFDMDKATRHINKAAPNTEVMGVSCTTGEGLERWYDWLRTMREKKRSTA